MSEPSEELRALTRDLRQYLRRADADDLPPCPPHKKQEAAPAHVQQQESAPAPQPAAQTPQAQEKETTYYQTARDNASAGQETVQPDMPQTPETDVRQEPMKNTPLSANTDLPQDKDLDAIRAEVEVCAKCPLGASRIKAVFGVGNPHAEIMFVGEGPGYEEDRKGEPFVGRAGQLLDKMMAAMSLSRQTVYIANIAKCHPMTDPSNPDKRGNDRPPTEKEMAACTGYLQRQIALIKPKYIVALGSVAAKWLTASPNKTLGALRGKLHDYKSPDGRDIKVIATYHPAALLRNPNWKRDAWQDLQMLMHEAGLKMPEKLQ